jgi:hypothetical protein
MATKASFLRGRRLRATRLDRSGRVIYGDGNQVVSKGFITVGYTSNVEEGEAITQTNAAGETCVSEPAVPTFTGFGVEAEFCEVDFALFSMLTGQEVVEDGAGNVVGITESTAIDLSGVNFALELWLGAQSDAAPSEGGDGFYGYILTPFLSGGTIGDITVENGAITFTITGMQTKNGSAWGAGPYDVELVDGVAAALSTPMGPNDHRRIMLTEVAPPAAVTGGQPVLDPSIPA